MKKRILSCALALALLLAAGCAGPAERRAPSEVDPSLGIYTEVRTPFSADTVAKAGRRLEEAGVLSRAELEALAPEEAASRALFIRLVAGAAGSGTLQPEWPGDPWYGPYVRAGYALGLFPERDGGTALSFLPADGFLLGDEGWAPMLEPIHRADAAVILARAAVGRPIPIETALFYDEEVLSQAAALVCAAEVLGGTLAARDEVHASLEELLDQGSIVHAGGFMQNADGKLCDYTNSAEALVNCYRLGSRLVELDFLPSADGHLICLHDRSYANFRNFDEGQTPTLAEWLEIQVCGSLSPLCLESVAGFMRVHPDLCLVTDTKGDSVTAARELARVCPDLLDRIAVQIYRAKDYEAIRALGFEHIIFTLYNLRKSAQLDVARWQEFAAGHKLAGYTFPKKLLEADYVAGMKKTGVRLFTHTLDQEAEIRAALDLGLDGVYTNRPEGCGGG